FEIHAADIDMGGADKRNNDAHITNGNVDHRRLLDLREPWIQVPRARQQYLLLQAAPAAAIEKRLGVLKIAVPRNDRAGDFARFNRRAIERGDNAHHVRVDALQEQLLRGHAVFRGEDGRNDGEQGGVDAISPGGQDAELAPFFAAVDKKTPGVLKVVAVNNLPQDALSRNGIAIGGDDQGNFALRHDG